MDNSIPDRNTYAWTTRIKKGDHLFLLDFQAENHYPNRSNTLRSVVELFRKHYHWIAKQEGLSAEYLGEQGKAMAKALAAERADDVRKEAHEKIIDLLTRAAMTDFMPHKIELTETARKLADAHNYPWPPPGARLTAVNQAASYVLEKVKRVMKERQTNSITLNELNPRCKSYDAIQLKEVLELLEQHEYLELEEERRAGPATLWVRIPVIQVNS